MGMVMNIGDFLMKIKMMVWLNNERDVLGVPGVMFSSTVIEQCWDGGVLAKPTGFQFLFYFFITQ